MRQLITEIITLGVLWLTVIATTTMLPEATNTVALGGMFVFIGLIIGNELKTARTPPPRPPDL